jgi:hypothetical protein
MVLESCFSLSVIDVQSDIIALEQVEQFDTQVELII